MELTAQEQIGARNCMTTVEGRAFVIRILREYAFMESFTDPVLNFSHGLAVEMYEALVDADVGLAMAVMKEGWIDPLIPIKSKQERVTDGD